MKKRHGFTLIELLVVIAIIALLTSILMPSLQRVRQQAKSVACLSMLKQWGNFFMMYANENNGYFMEGFAGTEGRGHNRWCKALGLYYKYDTKMTCCPNATRPWYDENGNPTGLEGTFVGGESAWGYYAGIAGEESLKGSYGINGWCNNPVPGQGHGGKPEKDHWRTPNLPQAGFVPLFLDAQRYNTWPEHTDPPPEFEGQGWYNVTHMSRVCINRHDGFVNCLFLDFSARKVGLKELWTLKWHKSYVTAGPWTNAGGARAEDWPEWLRSYDDY